MNVKVCGEVGLQAQKVEDPAIFLSRIGFKIVKNRYDASVAPDNVEEPCNVLTKLTDLGVIQQSRVDAASGNVVSTASLLNKVPGSSEVAHCLVAVVHIAQM